MVLKQSSCFLSWSLATVLSFLVAVALTNLEDPENARKAYAEAVRLDT